MTIYKPTNAREVLGMVQWALAQGAPVEVVGGASKRGIGRRVEAEHRIDLGKLRGVTLYEPEELVLSAKAGTPLAEVEKLLAAKGQEFAFEPMDYGPLLGVPKGGKPTLGGALAANLSGPRRLKAGAARDHVLGISAVSGRGEAFKSGGRVVKNVTGYDLSKAMAGSWGTLAVVTDVTFKVLPAAETVTTLVLRGLPDETAASAMAIAMGSPCEVSGAAHLPQTVAGKVAGGVLGAGAATLLRLEGFGPSVDYRAAKLRQLFGPNGGVDMLDAPTSRKVWRDVRDCIPFADGSELPVWRVSMAPTETAKMVMALRRLAAVDVCYDWAGGLAWLRMDGDAEAGPLRKLIRQFGGGHATLVRASPAQRAALAVFEPQAPALAALSARLKAQFDPKGILNPGRMG
jgi:glycolate oxidase FAD binding subunit